MDEDSKISKVSGYLEKKGKMKMMSSYKRYWFVLEGRLLLYYRSKDEYEAISPCKGSINLGPPCNVKPCASLAGVFQIETRNNTITLRAENREDQTRWMQGIMSALNQNKNAKKLIHFRYSLDELPQQQMVKETLERQNTIPQRMSSPTTQTNNTIIQRLQKLGAQSYGGSVGIINQMANSIKGESINHSNSKQNSDKDITTSRGTLLIENDQYSIIKRNSVTEKELRSGMKPTEHIYERIFTNNAEINYSVPCKKIEIREKPMLENTTPNINFEDKNVTNCNIDRPATFLLENETYGATTIRAIQNEEDNIDRENTLVVANDQYCSVDKRIRFPTTDSEVIYTEPKCTEFIDHNENHLVFSNDKGWKREEDHAYSTSKLCDYKKNDYKMNNTVEYEDLDKYLEYAEPIYSPNEDIYSECTNKTKSKLKKQRKKKLCKDNTDDDKKDIKLKKTSSFIKRVWKRKSKHKEKQTDIEELYETVPDAVVEKVTITDGTAVQMLSELQNILEHKKPILIERLSSESTKPVKNINECAQYEEIPTVRTPVNDETAVKMFSELQSILENKRTNLTDQLSTDKHSSTESTSGRALIESANANKINADVESASFSPGSEKIRPLLPPKNQKLDVCSPYHDFPTNNQPINKVLPPKKKPNLENLKSLDEILLDLDNEKSENNNKNKVKKLIKQFSESDFTENDVVLRTNKRSDYSREEIDSDELNRLLDQLARVTCAPILSPGATISLISPILTDEELIKLLPARRRRYSEPDYDIPRPHKSLTNLPRKKNSSENVIGSTRFFGPILKPSDINIKNTSEDSPQLLSISPDSLEPDIHVKKHIHQSHLPEDDKNSYTSHNYVQFKNFTASGIRSNDSHNIRRNTSTNFENSMKRFDNIIIENDIYAQPKSLHNLNAIKGIKINNTGNHLHLKSVKNIDAELDDDRLQDVFIDSLEI